MAEYMLLLHENPQQWEALTPEEIQQAIAKYGAWREMLIAEGKHVGGAKLKDEGGKWLTAQNGKVTVVDGPYSEAKEVMGGYFAIKADSYEEAVAISEGCPHLAYGGRIELRAVDHM